MAFTVNARRLESGCYRLEYGKGRKKITALAEPGVTGIWCATEEHQAAVLAIRVEAATLREVKELFGQQAELLYGRARLVARVTMQTVTLPATAAPVSVSDPVASPVWPPGFDPARGVATIDGIPHRYYPAPEGGLQGSWCWVGTDGLNPAERQTKAFWDREPEGAGE
jgi:hypothetical protein